MRFLDELVTVDLTVGYPAGRTLEQLQAAHSTYRQSVVGAALGLPSPLQRSLRRLEKRGRVKLVGTRWRATHAGATAGGRIHDHAIATINDPTLWGRR